MILQLSTRLYFYHHSQWGVKVSGCDTESVPFAEIIVVRVGVICKRLKKQTKLGWLETNRTVVYYLGVLINLVLIRVS